MCISMNIVCVDERHLTIHSTLRQDPALFVLEFSMTTHKRVHGETRKCFQNKPPRPFYINKSKTTWSRACLMPDLYARILLLFNPFPGISIPWRGKIFFFLVPFLSLLPLDFHVRISQQQVSWGGKGGTYTL